MLDFLLQEPKYIIHRRPRYKRKGKVEYDDATHSYYQKEEGRPDRYLISVTTFLKKFEESFVATDENTKETARKFGLNKEEVRLYWDNIKEVAANRGTFLHNSIEDFITGYLLDANSCSKPCSMLSVIEYLMTGVLQYKKKQDRSYVNRYKYLYNKYSNNKYYNNRYIGPINISYNYNIIDSNIIVTTIIIKNRGSFDTTKQFSNFFLRFNNFNICGRETLVCSNTETGQQYTVKLPEGLFDVIWYIWKLFRDVIEQGAKVHVEDLLHYLYPGIAGQSDLVIEGPDYIDIHDYKTNIKELAFENSYGKYYKYPINHLQVSKLQTYELQLSIYGYFAAKLYKKPVRNIIVHHFSNDRLYPIYLNYKKDAVLLLINYQVGKLKNNDNTTNSISN